MSYSGWQRRVCFSVLEITGHQRLRRHFGVESQFPICGPVRHIIQVSSLNGKSPFLAKVVLHRQISDI